MSTIIFVCSRPLPPPRVVIPSAAPQESSFWRSQNLRIGPCCCSCHCLFFVVVRFTLSFFYEERRTCPQVFANRLRTDIYSCSRHTRGVRIPAAPSEDVLRRSSLVEQRMSELTGYPCNRRKYRFESSCPALKHLHSSSSRRWESGKRTLLSTFPSACFQLARAIGFPWSCILSAPVAKVFSSKHTP
jgi:hypothetical protein